MPIFLFLIETYFLFKLYRKFKFSNCVAFIYLIVYFYCNSILFDIYIINNKAILTQTFVNIDPNSMAFDLTFFAYFLFLCSYFLFFYFDKKLTVNAEAPAKNGYRFEVNNILLVLLTALLLGWSVSNMQLDRTLLKEGATFLTQTVDVFIYLLFVFIVLYTRNNSAILKILFILSFILYCIFSYEREPLVLLLCVLLFYFNKKIKFIHILICGILFVFVFSYYKAFYGIFTGGLHWDNFYDYVLNKSISLAGLDPIASFTLLYDYFDKTPFHLSEHSFSYFTSFYDQYNRYVKDISVLSLGQEASQKYVHGQYGVAYSMILESILNFSILGPVILAGVTKVVYSFLIRKFFYMKNVIDIMLILIFASFVRSELMVILKIYVLPMIISLTVVSLFFQKRLKKSEMK